MWSIGAFNIMLQQNVLKCMLQTISTTDNLCLHSLEFKGQYF